MTYHRERRIEGLKKVVEQSPHGLAEALHSSYTHFLLMDLERAPPNEEVLGHIRAISAGLKTKVLTAKTEAGLRYLMGART